MVSKHLTFLCELLRPSRNELSSHYAISTWCNLVASVECFPYMTFPRRYKRRCTSSSRRVGTHSNPPWKKNADRFRKCLCRE